ncbi:MAG: TetR/AcrR family transcriptional regulator [Mogibacterium sp.]|nr:TetR/AcrR family transcriptional regulator [Mogibacterium sp.]
MSGQVSLKQRIIDSAWELFNEKGFENTTLNDIIGRAGVAKGSFYYYFRSKDTLLNTLSIVLDNEYRRLEKVLPDDMNAFDKLMFLNYEMHSFMEKMDYRLIANLYSAQLLKDDGANLLDRNRFYFTLIEKIITEGQQRGELVTHKTSQELVKIYSLCERALVTDWCMNNASYSLGEYSKEYMPLLYGAFRGSGQGSEA